MDKKKKIKIYADKAKKQDFYELLFRIFMDLDEIKTMMMEKYYPD